MSIPKNFVRAGRHYLESLDAKARICRCLVKDKSKYSLFKRTVCPRGQVHWEFTGLVTDSLDDCASAYNLNQIPQRRKSA